MLRVPTYLAPSPIHGLGLFTAGPIAAGTVIWEFDPAVDWRLTRRDLRRFPEPWRSQMRRYCYEEAEGMYVYCGDNGRFMNHSDDPSCVDPEGPWTLAARDLLPGSELTSDYRTFDLESARTGLAHDLAHPVGI